MKLKCDEPLSNVAFNFNVRRYTGARGGGGAANCGGAAQVDSIKTRVESAPGVCNQRLKQKCDEPLSNAAFDFNLRRYTAVARLGPKMAPWHVADVVLSFATLGLTPGVGAYTCLLYKST